jgi:hypothetical protein
VFSCPHTPSFHNLPVFLSSPRIVLNARGVQEAKQGASGYAAFLFSRHSHLHSPLGREGKLESPKTNQVPQGSTKVGMQNHVFFSGHNIFVPSLATRVVGSIIYLNYLMTGHED